MILQILDLKGTCKGIFSSGRLIEGDFENYINNNTIAWKHSVCLPDEQYKFLFLLIGKGNLRDFSGNTEKYDETLRSFYAQMKAAATSRIDMKSVAAMDIIPRKVLTEHYTQREVALINLLKLVEFGEDYEVLHRAHVLATTIASQPIKYNDKSGLKFIKYDIFGTATGRFSTSPGSFPVLTLKKEGRIGLEPKNDLFLEIDLNAAELRTFLALAGQTQPSGDLHEWNAHNVYRSLLTRDEAKKRIFSWLYNPDSDDFLSARAWAEHRSHIKKVFWRDHMIVTPFGRKIPVDERKCINYLIQSTTSDIVVESAYKIMKFLKDKKSFVSFTMHDSIVLDFDKTEYGLLGKIKDLFETNKLGRFLSAIKIGKNYGQMRPLDT